LLSHLGSNLLRGGLLTLRGGLLTLLGGGSSSLLFEGLGLRN